MGNPKLGISNDNRPMHYSVGAIIKNEDKYLLIDRKSPPYGFAGLAGHVDENEEPVQALYREVYEESSLSVLNPRLLLEEEVHDNTCKRGIDIHYWYLYECDVEGDVNRNPKEAKSIGYYTKEEIIGFFRKDRLEPVWEHWFRNLGII
ncbi:MAG: NUDIX domain-containing protein [Nanoarchaeota archaeon]|nr:NUDIX domain-containing protein [Nanoarchaeota archaeon]